MTETRTYWAVSILQSRTVWMAIATVLVGVLALPEVVAVIPLRFMPIITAVIGVANFGLRLVTVRPVTLSLPGTLTPVEVPKLDPPAPLVTD